MLTHVRIDNSFDAWRDAARGLLANGVPPSDVTWSSGRQQPGLFAEATTAKDENREIRVSPEFLRLARTVACFDDAEKWPLLYRILFRLHHENRNLLMIESDIDVRRARVMEKAIGRDVHKFHAFVRFRKVENVSGDEVFAAWHVPAHFTVERAVPFFARRYGTMMFSILTPKGCAHWNREQLVFSPPVDAAMAPKTDEAEDLWLLYYRSIFNPFRLNVSVMKRELPVKHWPTLPEAVLIPELVREARAADTPAS
ncbi:MAG TPA: TIGR03915 family putative DNA repair protein [Pyrinomonadaceae bacterium]|nr:TIGR03915 family putative DNA repair protein [Pyrinomonadaceae bacterium]